MTKPTYEDALTFIENKLGIQLLQFQKEVLRIMYENYPCYSYMIHNYKGKSITTEAAKLLNQLLTKENEDEIHRTLLT